MSPLTGWRLDASAIFGCLEEAAEAASELQSALLADDVVRIQIASERVERETFRASALAGSLNGKAGAYRRRWPQVRAT